MLTAREYGAASNQTLLINGRLILVAPALCSHSRTLEGSTHRLVAEARRLEGPSQEIIGETNIGLITAPLYLQMNLCFQSSRYGGVYFPYSGHEEQRFTKSREFVINLSIRDYADSKGCRLLLKKQNNMPFTQ